MVRNRQGCAGEALVLDKATFDMILGPLEDLNKRSRDRAELARSSRDFGRGLQGPSVRPRGRSAKMFAWEKSLVRIGQV